MTLYYTSSTLTAPCITTTTTTLPHHSFPTKNKFGTSTSQTVSVGGSVPSRIYLFSQPTTQTDFWKCAQC
jgi:hypothetical protein